MLERFKLDSLGDHAVATAKGDGHTYIITMRLDDVDRAVDVLYGWGQHPELPLCPNDASELTMALLTGVEIMSQTNPERTFNGTIVKRIDAR